MPDKSLYTSRGKPTRRSQLAKLVEEIRTWKPGQAHGFSKDGLRFILQTPESFAELLGPDFQVEANEYSQLVKVKRISCSHTP